MSFRNDLEYVESHGGGTFLSESLMPYNASAGFYVANKNGIVLPNLLVGNIPDDYADPYEDVIYQFIQSLPRYVDDRDAPWDNVHNLVGFWKNPDPDVPFWHIDQTFWFRDYIPAREFAAANNQLALYDIHNQSCIYIKS